MAIDPRKKIIIGNKGAPARTAVDREAGPDQMRNYPEFRDKIKIDPDRLDKMVLEQAETFMEVGERNIAASSARDAIKRALSIKDSELARKARETLLAADPKHKPTEGQVNDEVLLDKDRQAMVRQLAELDEAVDHWSNLRASFEQRMRMLREMVSLHATGWFNDAAMGSPRNTVRDALAGEARDRMAKDRKERGR